MRKLLSIFVTKMQLEYKDQVCNFCLSVNRFKVTLNFYDSFFVYKILQWEKLKARFFNPKKMTFLENISKI